MALKEIEKRLKKIEALPAPPSDAGSAFLKKCTMQELERLELILKKTGELSEDDQAFLEDLEVRYGF
jgi:hypothetical protein